MTKGRLDPRAACVGGPRWTQPHEFTTEFQTHMFAITKFLPAAALLALSGAAWAHGMSEAEKQSILDGGNMSYLQLGATHMLSGYDHLLFVFGIIFLLTTFRDIVKYVTAFTLGHSVTLIYATFNAIQMNYYLIDAVIGLSVCYIAFANMDGFRKYLGVRPPNLLAMIFGLGLIHGFGLSTRLQELPLSQDQLLLNILSFNVGVELGQITALALMLVVIAAWRKRDSFQPFSLAANYGLVAAGALLFLMQMHDYSHAEDPETVAQGIIPAAVASMPKEEAAKPWRETIEVVIPARGDKEFKLLVARGDTFDYAWRTGGAELFFDFHGEPVAEAAGAFQSFQKGTALGTHGTLTASFHGTHGWYWRNRSAEPVTVALQVRGAYERVAEKGTPAPEAPVKRHDSLD